MGRSGGPLGDMGGWHSLAMGHLGAYGLEAHGDTARFGAQRLWNVFHGPQLQRIPANRYEFPVFPPVSWICQNAAYTILPGTVSWICFPFPGFPRPPVGCCQDLGSGTGVEDHFPDLRVLSGFGLWDWGGGPLSRP